MKNLSFLGEAYLKGRVKFLLVFLGGRLFGGSL